MTRWQILIPHMPHRHGSLVRLLDVLAEQMQPDVEVVVYTDNLDVSYREKLQTLYDAATAEYVSSLGNDDSVAPDFVPRILRAMEHGPDYVGFRVRYTEAGVPQAPVVHSLQEGGWWTDAQGHHRDFMYYNPIRRELANQVRFRGDSCDVEWADDLRALGCVKTEVFIDRELLYYQRNPADNFHTNRQPMPQEDVPPLPNYPFVRHMLYTGEAQYVTWGGLSDDGGHVVDIGPADLCPRCDTPERCWLPPHLCVSPKRAHVDDPYVDRDLSAWKQYPRRAAIFDTAGNALDWFASKEDAQVALDEIVAGEPEAEGSVVLVEFDDEGNVV